MNKKTMYEKIRMWFFVVVEKYEVLEIMFKRVLKLYFFVVVYSRQKWSV